MPSDYGAIQLFSFAFFFFLHCMTLLLPSASSQLLEKVFTTVKSNVFSLVTASEIEQSFWL